MNVGKSIAAARAGSGLLRALKYRNYRLFFSGQAISLIGTWMQSTAMGWLVLRLTDSPWWVGAVAFAGQLPAFFVTPFGGLVADRWDRRRTLIVTQTLCMLQAFVLTLLLFTHSLNLGWIIGLTVFMGLVNAFDIPLRHAFVLDMVENREDLGNAIALNSSIFNAARLVGPSLAGFMIAHWKSEGICFFLNALSYLAVVAAFLAMRIKPSREVKFDGNVWEGLTEGFRYVYHCPPIRSVLLIVCLVCFIPFTVLLPVFAKNVLQGGAQMYGSLLAASGLGAFAGALYLASRRSHVGLGKLISVGSVVFGLGMVIISFAHVSIVSLVLSVLIGFGMMITMAASNTVLQTVADDDKRGRVMSFYTMSFMGTAPLGSLLGGYMAGAIGISVSYLIFGVCVIAGACVFALKVPLLTAQIRAASRTGGAAAKATESVVVSEE